MCVVAQVLGVYGGVVRRSCDLNETDQPDELLGKTINLSASKRWAEEGQRLVVDGNSVCNELAMCNDYRTNIRRYYDASCQERGANTEMVEVTLPGYDVPCILLVTTAAVSKNDEILLDYGNDYWSLWTTKQGYSAPKQVPAVLLTHAGVELEQGKPRRRSRRSAPAVVQLVDLSDHTSRSLAVYCSDNAHLAPQEKDQVSEVLGTVFCDQSWEKGSNAIRDHLDRLGSFTLSLCVDGAVLAAAMVDYDPRDCTAAVIRMMATHPAHRRRGCARLLNALIHQECCRRRVRYICVEVSNNRRGDRGADNDGHAIWSHFGYRPPRPGQLPQLVGPLFKDTSLLVMGAQDDRKRVQSALQQVKVDGRMPAADAS